MGEKRSMVKKQNKTDEEFEVEIPSPEKDDKASISAVDTKFVLAKKVIAGIREELANLENLLSSEAPPADLEQLIRRQQTEDGELLSPMQDGRIIEGVFDGQHMVGSDGRQYPCRRTTLRNRNSSKGTF